ncbi:hypothetical protein D9758_004709 [Tetrapyrgos nigripes]|uniref:LysM domain-containing protein n=1 Tax=Tetrapyrgos nigripes TaxID=182062 RepID=A0A8H5H078_9AGAR|nr:hypothetical protein D9758_004709 [Tetrapyrgos nigripes]
MFSYTRISAITSVALLLASFTNAQFGPSQCARNYTVKPGDVCDAISAAQHSSTFQLANANKGVIDANCTNLQVGEIICLGLLGKDCTDTTVVGGSNCEAITTNAGIPLSTLLHNNPNVLDGCTNIYPEEVLCTSGALFDYTV